MPCRRRKPPPGARRWSPTTASPEASGMPLAAGPFDVKVTPLSGAATDVIGRMSVDKVFHGELQGSSRFEMLTARTTVKESAAYVALEPVSGTLAGREGTFILQHCAIMD